jgi:hypothetical protein
MSDPYGHGETCDCERCMAYSEGLEARGRKSGPKRTGPPRDRMKRLPALTKVTLYVGETYGGIRGVLPPSGTAYLVGLLHGMFEDELAHEHLQAIDSLCRLNTPHATRLIGAQSSIIKYLREHGIADYRPRSKFARTPESP